MAHGELGYGLIVIVVGHLEYQSARYVTHNYTRIYANILACKLV